jgi:hypothetical protein
VKGKKSVTSSNQKHKSLSSSPGNQGGKSAAGTTDEMTMQTLKKFLQFQKHGGTNGTAKSKQLGKRSAGSKKSSGK